MIRYAVHPGWVKSMFDSQEHYINSNQLMHLYGVDPKECITINTKYGYDSIIEKYEHLIHLFPRYDGDYSKLPEPSEYA